MIRINKKDKFTQLWLEHKLLKDYIRPSKEIAQYYRGKKVECTLKRTSGLRKIPWSGCYEVPPVYPPGLPANFRDTTQTFPSLATSPSNAASNLGPFCKHCGAQLSKMNNYGFNEFTGFGTRPNAMFDREANYAIVSSHSEPLKDPQVVPSSTLSKETSTNEPTTNEVIQNQCLVLQALTHYRNPPATCCGDKCHGPLDDGLHHAVTDIPDQKDLHERNHDDEIYALAISNSPETCDNCRQGESKRALKSESKHVHHRNRNILCTNCGIFFNPKERVNQELLVYIEEDQSSVHTTQSQIKEVPTFEKEVTPEPERRSTLKSFWDAFVPTIRKKVSNDSLLQIEESVAKETKYSDCIVTTSHCLQFLLDREATFSDNSSASISEFDRPPSSKKKANKLNNHLRKFTSFQSRYKSFNRKKLLIPSNSSFDNIYNCDRPRSKHARRREVVREEEPSHEEEVIKKPIRRSSTKPRLSQEMGHTKASEIRKNSIHSDGEEMTRIKIISGENSNILNAMFNKNKKTNSRKYQLLPKRPSKFNKRKSHKSHSDELCTCKHEECLCHKNEDRKKKSQESKEIEIELCSSEPLTIPVTKKDKIREYKRLSQLLERAEFGCTCGKNIPNVSKSSISSRATTSIDESKKYSNKCECVCSKSAFTMQQESNSEQSIEQSNRKFKLSSSHIKSKRIIKLFSKGTSTDPMVDISDKGMSNISSDECIYSSLDSISIDSVGQTLPVSTVLLTESVIDSNSITLLTPLKVSIEDLPEKLLKYNDKNCNDFSSGKVFSGSSQTTRGINILTKGQECQTESEKLSKFKKIEKTANQTAMGPKLLQFCGNFPEINSCGGLGRTYGIQKMVTGNRKVGKVIKNDNIIKNVPKKLKVQMCPHGSSMNIIHEEVSETASESNLKPSVIQKESKNLCAPLTDQEKQSKRNDFWICHTRNQGENVYKNIRNPSEDRMSKKIEFLTKRKHFLHSSSCICSRSYSSSVYPTMNILPGVARHSHEFCRNRAVNLETAIRELDRMSLDNCEEIGTKDPRVYTCFCKHFAEMAQELVEESASSSESINTDDLDRNPQHLESIFPGLMTNLQTRKDVDVVSLLANILDVKHPLVQTPETVLRKPKGYSIKKDLEQIDEKKKINLQRLEEKVLLNMKKLDMELEKRKALVGTLKQKIIEEKQRLDQEKDRLNRRNSELEKTDPVTGEVIAEKQQGVSSTSKKEKKVEKKKSSKKGSKQGSKQENKKESKQENTKEIQQENKKESHQDLPENKKK